jgi:2Fe-2S ferredoxin
VLDIAFGAGVDIDHACGGVCACTTCHVKVLRGEASCSPASEDELDMLETARNRDGRSRLGCRCVPDGSADLVVVVPTWFGSMENP